MLGSPQHDTGAETDSNGTRTARLLRLAQPTPTDPCLAQLLSEVDVKASWGALTRSEARQALQALIKRVTIKPLSPDWNRRRGLDFDRILIKTAWTPLSETDQQSQ